MTGAGQFPVAVPSFYSLMGKNPFVILPINGPDSLFLHNYVFDGFEAGQSPSHHITFSVSSTLRLGVVALVHRARSFLSQLSLCVSFSCGLVKLAVCFTFVGGVSNYIA